MLAPDYYDLLAVAYWTQRAKKNSVTTHDPLFPLVEKVPKRAAWSSEGQGRMTFPRSRRELHEAHPEHFFQLHVFSHGGPHQGLQIPDESVDVVVVDDAGVAVEVVEEASPPKQEQQASLDSPFVQRVHSNTPPCITH